MAIGWNTGYYILFWQSTIRISTFAEIVEIKLPQLCGYYP